MPAYVAKLTARAYQAECSDCPGFRRVAWTMPETPAESAQSHNAERHPGASLAILERPASELQTMLA